MFANFLSGFLYLYIRYVHLSNTNKLSFFPLKLKKWFGDLKEYLIIHNILLYDIVLSGVDRIYKLTVFGGNNWNTVLISLSLSFAVTTEPNKVSKSSGSSC